MSLAPRYATPSKAFVDQFVEMIRSSLTSAWPCYAPVAFAGQRYGVHRSKKLIPGVDRHISVDAGFKRAVKPRF
jgi:hypothetical protein